MEDADSRLIEAYDLGFCRGYRKAVEMLSGDDESSDSNPLLKRPISFLGLKGISVTVLNRAEVKTIGELVAMNDTEYLSLRNAGRLSLEHVRGRLAAHGLHLTGDSQPTSTPS